MQLLTNHLGYERFGAKQVIILAAPNLSATHAEVFRCDDAQSVMQLPLKACGPVAQWHTGNTYSVDFTALSECGEYYLRVSDTQSAPFTVAEGLLMQQTFSDVLHYFKSQRCGGIFERADQHVPILNSDETADVRGGWYDASGDVSKYLSHLSYSNYLNPQQTPMVVWNMLKAFEELEGEDTIANFTRIRLMEEAIHGADFLLRMQNPQGYFYMTVFDKWSKSTEQREICSYSTQGGIKSDDYQAGFRQGGGIAIAALAAASRLLRGTCATQLTLADDCQGDTYLQTAESGYWHLIEMNTQYLDNGTENIIDEYCALLAAVELYRATENTRYLEESRGWSARLAARQMSDHHQAYFWSANSDGRRPYYHASEAGLPAISLMQYLTVERDEKRQQAIRQVLSNALRFELNITHEVNNPFGYPRQYVKAVDGEKHTAFFVPHNNESGYWWQGENARLASLSAMAYMAQRYTDDSQLKGELKTYAQRLTDWLLGLNPFDVSMLGGHGRNNPDYLPELGFANAKGGVCNGITSGFDNEQDIAFNPAPQKNDILQNWRWGEQWIPHAGWYLLAITMQFKERHHDQAN
ncbi:glycoside hydrolase family 9 protein [Photobacterium sp. SDRW27]|uniref:glycoside hydrolase family 9 protein n=1 Tax=Photobacterium obscurum TaxID=2829490 RepID=UPI002243282F|nr:glycoside hydrolase family 9 protein [Photobacterium obscurum]MCW8330132.1 glycoside hydrolase family 9 protein [Photobacterium obscurum]